VYQKQGGGKRREREGRCFAHVQSTVERREGGRTEEEGWRNDGRGVH